MTKTLWRFDMDVTPDMAEAYEFALEPFFDAVTQYLDDDERCERLEAYGETQPSETALQDAIDLVANRMDQQPPAFKLSEVENKDWLAEFARENPPLSIGRYFIYGSHFKEPLPVGKTALKVEAATAFGTGGHASTEGCLRALDDLACRYDFKHPLDMGCGSAILAMAIAKTWGVPVVASDIDQPSVEVAAYNAQVNGVAGNVHAVWADGYNNPSIFRNGPYDLIMANILARPLSKMAKDLAQNLQSGGFCVLAGFLKEDANWVFGAHRCHGLKLVKRINVNGWQTLILRKR